mmetsp:Transcript_45705/g.133075  ORF Transcript_45705/g.133075 Transcript_45705/m.133075 type:complete len:284 (-) Transcript_45705:1063-1914(-)
MGEGCVGERRGGADERGRIEDALSSHCPAGGPWIQADVRRRPVSGRRHCPSRPIVEHRGPKRIGVERRRAGVGSMGAAGTVEALAVGAAPEEFVRVCGAGPVRAEGLRRAPVTRRLLPDRGETARRAAKAVGRRVVNGVRALRNDGVVIEAVRRHQSIVFALRQASHVPTLVGGAAQLRAALRHGLRGCSMAVGRRGLVLPRRPGAGVVEAFPWQSDVAAGRHGLGGPRASRRGEVGDHLAAFCAVDGELVRVLGEEVFQSLIRFLEVEPSALGEGDSEHAQQ